MLCIKTNQINLFVIIYNTFRPICKLTYDNYINIYINLLEPNDKPKLKTLNIFEYEIENIDYDKKKKIIKKYEIKKTNIYKFTQDLLKIGNFDDTYIYDMCNKIIQNNKASYKEEINKIVKINDNLNNDTLKNILSINTEIQNINQKISDL